MAAIYKNRWQIELFFKWIKQNLRFKAFYGTHPIAVRSQIWIAIRVYLMVAIFRKQDGIKESLSRIVQVVSANVFSQNPLTPLLTTHHTRDSPASKLKQLSFRDL